MQMAFSSTDRVVVPFLGGFDTVWTFGDNCPIHLLETPIKEELDIVPTDTGHEDQVAKMKYVQSRQVTPMGGQAAYKKMMSEYGQDKKEFREICVRSDYIFDSKFAPCLIRVVHIKRDRFYFYVVPPVIPNAGMLDAAATYARMANEYVLANPTPDVESAVVAYTNCTGLFRAAMGVE